MRQLLQALAAVVLLAPALAASASANTITSSNWAGYAAHGNGVRFRQVSAEWREPNLSCSSGGRSYSSIWVGLGGYATSSSALEQVGTEADCSASGRTLTSVWDELVPAASQAIPLNVYPGDLVSAAVSVAGHRVSVTVADRTRDEFFTKNLYASSVDVSSADWIVEAPSNCSGSGSCSQLPLAEFGAVAFSNARAITGSGHSGRITSRNWQTTRLVLTPGGRRFVSSGDTEATPSSLQAAGTAFVVRRTGTTVFSTRAPARAVRLTH